MSEHRAAEERFARLMDEGRLGHCGMPEWSCFGKRFERALSEEEERVIRAWLGEEGEPPVQSETYPVGTETTTERIRRKLGEHLRVERLDDSFTAEQGRILGVIIGAEANRLDRRIDAILRMRVEDAEPESEATTGEPMPVPEWTSVEDVAEGLTIETVGRRVMVYPDALRRALRQAVSRGRAEGIRDAASTLVDLGMEGERSGAVAVDALRKAADAIERGGGEPQC